jgi:predicted nucleotidyltransferase
MIMKNKPTYPTVQHEKASEAIVNFYSDQDIDSVLLTCSCARGKATKDSCLDIIVLVSPGMNSTSLKRYLMRLIKSVNILLLTWILQTVVLSQSPRDGLRDLIISS